MNSNEMSLMILGINTKIEQVKNEMERLSNNTLKPLEELLEKSTSEYNNILANEIQNEHLLEFHNNEDEVNKLKSFIEELKKDNVIDKDKKSKRIKSAQDKIESLVKKINKTKLNYGIK